MVKDWDYIVTEFGHNSDVVKACISEMSDFKRRLDVGLNSQIKFLNVIHTVCVELFIF
jgi:hypothetical protein